MTTLQETARGEESALPIFPESVAGSSDDPFRSVLKAYEANNLTKAIQETEQLRQRLNHSPLAETAAFLLGDLHLRAAEKGSSEHLAEALSAFQQAQIEYPDSENAIRSLWRIGQIYGKMRFYEESVGSFRRIITKHPHSRFVAEARLGIAQTYRAWDKWKEAADAFDRLDLSPFPPEARASALLEHADVLYHLEAFEETYQISAQAESKAPQAVRERPEILFQYGDAAYRTKRYGRAREIFLAFFNIYSRESLAPIALARVGDTWRQEGKTKEARQIYIQVNTDKSDSPEARIGKLMAMAGDWTMPRCQPHLSEISIAPCQGDAVQDPKQEALTASEIAARAGALLQEGPISIPERNILLEAAGQLRKKGFFEEALKIEGRLMNLLPPSPLKDEIRGAAAKSVAEAVDRWSKNKEDIKVVELFQTYPSFFTPQILISDVGLKVGVSHDRSGLYSEAIDLYEPIAANGTGPVSEEALRRLGEALLQQRNYARAQQKLQRFLARYPKSGHHSEALANLALAFDRQDRMKQAIQRYKEWLTRYPNDPDQRKRSLQLAKVYHRANNFRREVAIYLQWVQKEPASASELSLPLGDAYYRMGEYQKAIQSYQSALDMNKDHPESDWIQFQLAKCYIRLGQKKEGRKFYDQLAQNAKDPLMKQLAVEKRRDL